jgi:predicted nucleotidyltransferase
MDHSRIARLREAAEQVFDQSPVCLAYLFGSAAVGHDRPDSDVDMAVYLDPSAAPDQHLDLQLDLGGRLERAARAGSIDLVVMNEAPIALLGRILRDRGALYSRDEPTRVRFESRTFREFCDFDFHARALDRELLRAIAEGRR